MIGAIAKVVGGMLMAPVLAGCDELVWRWGPWPNRLQRVPNPTESQP